MSSSPTVPAPSHAPPGSTATSSGSGIPASSATPAGSNTTSSATGAASGAATSSSSTSSSKHYVQHAISQLPMTTRKKLSHLRAQIKRQASKAARSRLEKRNSVAGMATTGTAGTPGSFSTTAQTEQKTPFGLSLDGANPTTGRQHRQHHPHHHQDQHQHPTNSTSVDTPNIYPSGGGSSSSPAGASSSITDANISSTFGHHHHHHQHPSSTENNNNNSGGPAHGTSKHHQLHHQTSVAGTTNPTPSSNQHSSAIGGSVHQKNFKQKLIALIKKFRTDGSDFDSEEQYREALERELMKAAAGRGSKAIEELLEEDIDDVEAESGSDIDDWDDISDTSTPKPSLRPFFSSTTLDKI